MMQASIRSHYISSQLPLNIEGVQEYKLSIHVVLGRQC